MSLIEYLPEVVSTVQRHCSASAATASLRQDLLSELGQTKLGPVIEADPIGARYMTWSLPSVTGAEGLALMLLAVPDCQIDVL